MTTQEFVTMPKTDPELAGKLSNAASLRETWEIATAHGLTDTFETFVLEMKKIKETIGQLSEADLDSVAGGMDEQGTVSASTTTMFSSPF